MSVAIVAMVNHTAIDLQGGDSHDSVVDTECGVEDANVHISCLIMLKIYLIAEQIHFCSRHLRQKMMVNSFGRRTSRVTY